MNRLLGFPRCVLNFSLNDKHGVISCRILRKRTAVSRTENRVSVVRFRPRHSRIRADARQYIFPRRSVYHHIRV
jgi:hypothetical protein